MKKSLLIATISLGFLATSLASGCSNAKALQCEDSPFRCKLQEKALNGWYGVLESGTLSPDYAITVEDNMVTGDYSDDEYGCLGRGCDHYASSGKNEYIIFNEKQIIRKTPNGNKTVLTWFKGLDGTE